MQGRGSRLEEKEYEGRGLEIRSRDILAFNYVAATPFISLNIFSCKIHLVSKFNKYHFVTLFFLEDFTY